MAASDRVAHAAWFLGNMIAGPVEEAAEEEDVLLEHNVRVQAAVAFLLSVGPVGVTEEVADEEEQVRGNVEAPQKAVCILPWHQANGVTLFSVLPFKSRWERAVTATMTIEKDAAESCSYEAQLRASAQYDPLFLDDPNMKSGRHRTIMTLPSVMVSVLYFATAKDTKKELNRLFKERHSWIEPSMSLTKIRKIKELYTDVLATADIHVDTSTAALAIAYFESLIVKGAVTKRNRKVMAAVCLLLALKFNQFMLPNDNSLESVLARTCSTFGVRRSDVLESEFTVFSTLNFDLHMDPSSVMPHYVDLGKKLDILLDSALASGLSHK